MPAAACVLCCSSGCVAAMMPLLASGTAAAVSGAATRSPESRCCGCDGSWRCCNAPGSAAACCSRAAAGVPAAASASGRLCVAQAGGSVPAAGPAGASRAAALLSCTSRSISAPAAVAPSMSGVWGRAAAAASETSRAAMPGSACSVGSVSVADGFLCFAASTKSSLLAERFILLLGACRFCAGTIVFVRA